VGLSKLSWSKIKAELFVGNAELFKDSALRNAGGSNLSVFKELKAELGAPG
jgi:hypothetical protein